MQIQLKVEVTTKEMQRILKYFAVFIVFVISNSNSLGENISSLIVDYENNVTPEQSVSDKG